MLAASVARIEELLADDDVVLDVGGALQPFARADWVVDLVPYDERGTLGRQGSGPERFGPDTWLVRDVCDREPLPFADGSIDFAICSHTLEDVRDPVWICAELARVARAGYVEVPSRLEEQAWGVAGPWVGWSHHHWLVDVGHGRIDFAFKPHNLHGRERYHFPAGFADTLAPEERVQTLWWEGSFEFRERTFAGDDELDPYLAGLVARHADRPGARHPRRARRLLRRLRGG